MNGGVHIRPNSENVRDLDYYIIVWEGEEASQRTKSAAVTMATKLDDFLIKGDQMVRNVTKILKIASFQWSCVQRQLRPRWKSDKMHHRD